MHFIDLINNLRHTLRSIQLLVMKKTQKDTFSKQIIMRVIIKQALDLY